MLQAMAHREPDDQGIAEPGPHQGEHHLVMGATRLAILDRTPAGHQPFPYPRTDSWLVFNGEIHNHLACREELGSVDWQSRSDTETVLRCALAWGPGCLERFRGMFAFALWDGREGQLWCARDRLGIKPLYLFAEADRVLLASELRALLASGLVPRRVDPQGLSGFARFGAVPEPWTLIEGVHAVPAGSWLRVRGTTIEGPSSYWRPACPDGPEPLQAIETVAVPMDMALRRAVNEQMVADAPVGCFLSGGLDSAVVTALAGGSRLHTFTLGLAAPELDESAAAEAVAEHCGTCHHTIRLGDAELARQVRDAVLASDQPSADAINTALVARAAAEAGLRVVLSGLGADELFGGYPTFDVLSRAERMATLLATTAHPPGPSRAAALEAGLSRRQRYDRVRAWRSPEELAQAGLAADVGFGSVALPALAPLASAVSLLELTGYMRSMLLRDGDGMSMAVSLELRFPFLDHTLVDLCLEHQAARWTFGESKPVLRHLARPLLPASTLRRAKQGFELPMAPWMRGSLRGFCEEGLACLLRHAAVPGPLRERVRQDQDLPAPQWRKVWQWVVLGHWLEAHLR